MPTRGIIFQQNNHIYSVTSLVLLRPGPINFYYEKTFLCIYGNPAVHRLVYFEY